MAYYLCCNKKLSQNVNCHKSDYIRAVNSKKYVFDEITNFLSAIASKVFAINSEPSWNKI